MFISCTRKSNNISHSRRQKIHLPLQALLIHPHFYFGCVKRENADAGELDSEHLEEGCSP